MPIYSCRIYGLTPARGIFRDLLVTPLTLFLWGYVLYSLFQSSDSIAYWLTHQLGVDAEIWHLWLGAIFSPILVFPVLYWSINRILSLRMVVFATDQTITFRRHFRKYEINRKVGLVRFMLRDHKWAKFEKKFHNWLRHTFKAKMLWLREYFQRSHRLMVEIDGRRTLITPIYGSDIPLKNLGELNAILSEADVHSGTGRGASEDPRDTWSKQAGDF